MPEDIRLWEIVDRDNLKELKRTKLDLEERIENWLEKDHSLIANDLLVIGRQVSTDFGGVIDLLCLDSEGDIVIVELKRDKTPREITAQVLDYASWVKDLSNERITELANEYLKGKGPLEEAFKQRFGEEIPEILNENHKMLIVASEIDSSSERIIKYLSDYHGVGINAVTFQYFLDEKKREMLARVFLIDPYQAEISTGGGGKRKPNLTFEQLHEIAEKNGVGDLFLKLSKVLEEFFDYKTTTRSTVAFIGVIEGSRHTIFSIVPGESYSKRIASGEGGVQRGLRFQVRIDRFSKYLNLDSERISKILPPEKEEFTPYKGGPKTLIGFFRDEKEVDSFSKSLSELRK
jgi:molybdopterin biosynthesis enzyme MoaB